VRRSGLRYSMHACCGREVQSKSGVLIGSDSSPRLRGTLHQHAGAGYLLRSIPAPAGNRPASPDAARLVSGSSPRLRGTPELEHEQGEADRFIRAPAGNACSPPTPTTAASVHPRACGERSMSSGISGYCAGSSPRLRGAPILRCSDIVVYRFIPAPAGNARLGPAERVEGSVHPRACGERAHALERRPARHGSSPRLRGTPALYGHAGANRRFIPAPAGNARPSSCAILASVLSQKFLAIGVEP
jgi:hypothetical protein